MVVTEAGRVTGRYVIDHDTVLGRSGGDADIVVLDGSVSRRHARVAPRSSEHYTIEDLGSRNGTFVNGLQINAPAVFGARDRVTLGRNVVLKLSRFDPAEEDLRRRERLEALGRLTAGVIHDLNNMLGAVLATAECMRDVIADNAEAGDCLDDICSAAARAADLTPRLMGFVRGDSFCHGTVDVSRLGAELVELVRRTFDPEIAIKTDIAAELAVSGDAGELHQLLMNLCLNARDAMPNGGVLTIRAKRLGEGELPAELSFDQPQVLLQVADTGKGIAADSLPRIFEPFFSTKGERGFGMGLATVQELAGLHGGQVQVRSTPGIGSVFNVYLPEGVAGARDNPTTQPPPSGGPSLRGRTVLVVDDEPFVRKAAARVLKRAGASIVEASDGGEALAIYAEQRIDAVLLDLGMPRMGGEETLHRLTQSPVGAAVVVLTGNVDKDRLAATHMLGASGVITKPFTAADLVAALDRAIGLREGRFAEPPTGKHHTLEGAEFEFGPPSTRR